MTSQQPDPSPPQDGATGYGSSTPPPPAPPAYGTPPAGSPGYTPPSALTPSDERMWAMLSHLGGIVLGFVAPLVVWLVFRERSAFVDDQGKESLNFQITVAIALVISSVLTTVLIGLLMMPLVLVANLILCVLAGVAANKGERYRYPFALRLVK